MQADKKKRILHIHVLPVISGSGIDTFLIMKGLKHKYSMEMACAPGGPLNDLVMKYDMTVRPIKNFVSEVAPVKDLHALWQVYRLLQRTKYDLIHTHNSKGGFIGRLAAYLVGNPPVIHEVHGYAFHENEPWIRRSIFFALEVLARHWSKMVICISQPLVDIWVKRKLAPPERIRKIYSGIEIAEFQKTHARDKIRRELGLRPDQIAVGQVSKLWEGKGHEDIIDACPIIFEEVPDLKIFFVGDGPIRKKLEEIVYKNGLQGRIVFLGHCDNIAEVTSALDIAVLASHFEGMGRVLLEAMAAGLPIVATRVGGIPDLVVDQETGFLVEPHNPEQLAQSILRLASDLELRKRMGNSGRQRVDSRFSATTMLKQIDSVYQEVLFGTSRN